MLDRKKINFLKYRLIYRQEQVSANKRERINKDKKEVIII